MRPPYPFRFGDNTTGQCSACGEVFAGEHAFDHHIRGEGPDRGCIDPATDKPSKGGSRYWYDNRGRWHHGQPVNPNEYDARTRARAELARTGRRKAEGQNLAPENPAQVSQVPPGDSEGSTPAPRSPAIVIRTIEGRTPTPPMTPERHAEQVAKLERAGIRVPPSEAP